MQKLERKEAVEKYFLKTPDKPDYKWEYCLIGAGGVLLIVMLIYTGFLSWLCGIGAGYVLFKGVPAFFSKKNIYEKDFKAAEPKPSDKQMDDWLEEDKQLVLREALNRLDIEYDETSAAPLMIDGPSEKTWWTIGKDKMLRYSNHDILLFFLTEHHVATFKCELDIGVGTIINEQSKEFPYKDITNLETATVNNFMQFIGDKQTTVRGTQRFSLFTSGSNQITIKYFFDKSTSNDQDYILPHSDAENTVKTIRKRLKEYKDKFSTAI